MTRAHIRLNSSEDVASFIQGLNEANREDTFALTDGSMKYHVDARSLMGVIYMMTEYNDHCYLINETRDGQFPNCIDKFRVL